MISLYKRDAKGKPLIWSAKEVINIDSPDCPVILIISRVEFQPSNLLS